VSDKYWNGYQWVTPAKPGVEVVYDVPSHEERVALLEAEVNPPDVTEERWMEQYGDETFEILPEQPTPNLVSIPLTLYPEKVVYATKPISLETIESATEQTLNPPGRDPIITDEVRARVRRELEAKDGGSK
jgi:hypothetical protein